MTWWITGCLCTAATAHAQQIWRGPYVNDVTRDAATLVWETATPQTATVHYGATLVSEHTLPVTTPRQHQSVRLTGLSALVSAGGEIRYAVEIEGVTRSGRFTTAVSATTPFAFVVFGDNRSAPLQHAAVVQAVLDEPVPVRFLVATGDMVSDGQTEADWDEFFTIEAPLLAQLPMFTVIGNHEVDGPDFSVTERIFEPPTQVPPASGTDAYYHQVYGNVELIVLDSHVNSLYRFEGFTWPGGQEAWLEEVLANPPPGVQHRFVLIHVGPYSSKGGRLGNYWLRFWLEAFKDAGVTAVLSGHDHYVERGFTGNGLIYAVHGGGGAPLYDTEGPRTTLDHTIVYSESKLGYILIEIDGPLAQLTTRGVDGETLDYVAYGDALAPECTSTPACASQTLPEFACTGARAECLRNACVPICVEVVGDIVACLRDDDCASDCAGTASCERPDAYNPLTWHCRCATRECVTSTDCTGRPSPVPDCAGSWACVDEVCEFTPAAGTCAAGDPGPPAVVDGGPSDVAPADPGAAGDPAAPTPADGAPESGCGCGPPSRAALPPLAGATLITWRRRRRPSRTR